MRSEIDSWIARWKAEDPSMPVDAFAQADTHDWAAQVLRALADPSLAERARDAAYRHIRQLVPSAIACLRGNPELSRSVVPLLVGTHARAAAPYVLSVLRRPSIDDSAARQLELAHAYSRMVRPELELVGEFLPYFDGAPVRPEHMPRAAELGADLLRRVAFRLLWPLGAEPEVFAAYLRAFADAQPYAEAAIRRRGRPDRRVVWTLREQLEAADPRSAAFETLASYLARMGDRMGKEALLAYRCAARQVGVRGQPRVGRPPKRVRRP